jgi:NitT/TauT family transport system permease protein
MRYIRFAIPHLLFASLIISTYLPAASKVEGNIAFVVCVIAVEAGLIFKCKSKTAADTGIIVFGFLLFWEVATTKFPNANTMLYPPPENVFNVFITDWAKILGGIGSSLSLLAVSLVIAVIAGVILGMAVGWFEHARKVIFPIAKVLSPIPAIIYSPYVVALSPSFRAASEIILVLSVFWPLFMNTVTSVASIDRKIVESSKVMKVKTPTMFAKVLFPYCLPKLLGGMAFTVSISFMVLTAAELIGATSGLGWYVKYYADFAQYTRVIAGIIVIGVVVTLIGKGFNALEKLLIKWR